MLFELGNILDNRLLLHARFIRGFSPKNTKKNSIPKTNIMSRFITSASSSRFVRFHQNALLLSNN